MAVLGFQQDPEAPEGAGMFQLDDGRQIYAHDPDLARQLSGQPYQVADLVGPKQDNRFAGPGAVGPDGLTDLQRADLGMVSPQDAQKQLGQMNVGAPKADLDLVTARQQAAQPQVKGPAAPPKDVIEPGGAAAGGGPSEFDQNVSNYVLSQAKRQGAPRPEAWIPKSRAETVETEGVPYNSEDAAVRIAANRQVAEAKAATANMLQERAVNEAAQAKAAQPELLQRAAEAQKQLDAQHASYQRERADLDRAIEASNSTGGASEWFASKNALAQAAIVFGQAFGAYAATLSGGQNWAQQQLNSMMEHDIAAQRDQAKRGVDNALRRLELRYHDQDQAEAALRIAQGNILNNVMAMHASANQAQDVQAAAQEWAAQNQQALVAQEQKFQNAAYGKHTVKLDVAHQSASGGAAPDIAAIAKQLKAAGLTDEQIRTAIFGKGGAGQSPDAIDRKNVATVNGQAFEFDSPQEAQRAKEKVPTLSKLIQDGERAKALFAKGGTLTQAERSELSSIQREMSLGFGPAFSGSTRVNETEIHEGQQVLGDPNNFLKTDMFGSTAAAIDTVINNAKAEQAGIMEGGVRVSRRLGTNAQGQRERQYNYQTAPRTLEEVE